jgi:hypothetical protein
MEALGLQHTKVHSKTLLRSSSVAKVTMARMGEAIVKAWGPAPAPKPTP